MMHQLSLGQGLSTGETSAIHPHPWGTTDSFRRHFCLSQLGKCYWYLLDRAQGYCRNTSQRQGQPHNKDAKCHQWQGKRSWPRWRQFRLFEKMNVSESLLSQIPNWQVIRWPYLMLTNTLFFLLFYTGHSFSQFWKSSDAKKNLPWKNGPWEPTRTQVYACLLLPGFTNTHTHTPPHTSKREESKLLRNPLVWSFKDFSSLFWDYPFLPAWNMYSEVICPAA